MKAAFSAFSEEEFKTRFARARELLREEQIHVCIMVAPEHIY